MARRLNMGDTSTLLQLVALLPQEDLRGAEIGVHRGLTSQRLLKRFPTLFLWMVDSWATWPADHTYRRSGDRCGALSQAQQDRFAQEAEQRTVFAAGRRTILRSDSCEAASCVPDKSLTFVFVDGDHTYEGVWRDLNAWWPKLQVGGLLCGHDYGHGRDRRGIWGVREAVHAYASRVGKAVQADRTTCWWLS